jgi:hypothetical protein
MISNDDLERMCKEAAVTLFKALPAFASRHRGKSCKTSVSIAGHQAEI